MGREYVKWYGRCVVRMFGDSKDSWECRKVVQLSSGIEKRPKEEIIQSTRYRFLALLRCTTYVFKNDRRYCEHYQLPRIMYYVVRCMFRESVAAIASEVLVSIVNCDYEVSDTILKRILYADCPEEGFLEKMTILFTTLEVMEKGGYEFIPLV